MPLHADLCVRLQNASRARLRSVPLPHTQANLAILAILLRHGFLHSLSRGTVASAHDPRAFNTAPLPARRLWVDLKYTPAETPVLRQCASVSKPSKRIHMNSDELLRWATSRRAQFVTPLLTGELGIVDCGKHGWWEVREAIERKLGGEVVARVS